MCSGSSECDDSLFQAAIGIENAHLDTQELEKQCLEQQLIVAQHIQKSFLLGPPPDINKPALQVGGDYYHYGLCPAGNVSLVVADVLGKGCEIRKGSGIDIHRYRIHCECGLCPGVRFSVAVFSVLWYDNRKHR